MNYNELVSKLTTLSEELEQRTKDKDSLAEWSAKQRDYAQATKTSGWGMGLWEANGALKALLKEIEQSDDLMADELEAKEFCHDHLSEEQYGQ